jgi:hypothetical protein
MLGRAGLNHAYGSSDITIEIGKSAGRDRSSTSKPFIVQNMAARRIPLPPFRKVDA